jgi:hypothetical protein
VLPKEYAKDYPDTPSEWVAGPPPEALSQARCADQFESVGVTIVAIRNPPWQPFSSEKPRLA